MIGISSPALFLYDLPSPSFALSFSTAIFLFLRFFNYPSSKSNSSTSYTESASGDAYWKDVAASTEENIVSGNCSNFGARFKGVALNEWSPTDCVAEFGSDLEAEFEYDGSEV